MERPSSPLAFAGAVLAGGASRRMGRDKAGIVVGAETLLQRSCRVLREAGAAPIVAIGGAADVCRHAGVERVADRSPGEGPLGGVLTALDWAATPDVGATWVAVIAVDLVRLDPSVVRRLIDAAAAADDPPDVVVARGTRDEPLVALWRVSTCRGPVAAAFADGTRAVHRAWDALTLQRVAVTDALLANANTPADLDAR